VRCFRPAVPKTARTRLFKGDTCWGVEPSLQHVWLYVWQTKCLQCTAELSGTRNIWIYRKR
jgi:hypothetical protein